MKILKIIGLVLLVLVLLVALLTFLLPTSFHVERSINIEAPRTLVTEHTVKFRHFQEWSPWSELDPDMIITIDGEDGEVGTIYRWDGGDVSGKGSQEIVSRTDDRVDISLIFTEPFASENSTYYEFESLETGETKVTWGMHGNMSRPFNVMGLFMNMEARIGADYEKGLQNLKERVESIHATQSTTGSIRVSDQFERTYLVHTAELSMDEISDFIPAAMAQLAEEAGSHGLSMNGYPASLYYTWDEDTRTTQMAVAIPVANVDESLELELVHMTGHGFFIDHKGPYDTLEESYDKMMEYMRMHELTENFVAVEEYIQSEGSGHSPQDFLTRIYFIWEDGQ